MLNTAHLGIPVQMTITLLEEETSGGLTQLLLS